MKYAFTSENKLVASSEAYKYGDYKCPICRGRLDFFPGKSNKPHFRHMRGIPKAIIQECELYSSTVSSFNHVEQEELANQKVRLVVMPNNNSYDFFIRFPYIEEKYSSRVIYDDLYFNYYCNEVENLTLNNKKLLRSINECLIEVPLNETYTFTCDNPKYEKIMNLQITGKFEPFKNGPLIFKNIQGEYKSVQYREITLEGRFFIVSKKMLNIPNFLKESTHTIINDIHLYDLNMPENSTEKVKDWFSKGLNYTLLLTKSYLDLIEPIRFKKIGSTYEVVSDKCKLLWTSKEKKTLNPLIYIVSPVGKVKRISPNKEGVITLNLESPGDYMLSVEGAISEIYTIRKRKVNAIPNSKHFFNINNENNLLNSKIIYSKKVEITTNLPFNLHNTTEICYSYKHGGNHNIEAPAILTVPRILKVELRNQLQEDSVNINWDIILHILMAAKKYPKRVYSRNLMKKLKNLLQKSDYKHKKFLLSLIRKQSVYVPEQIINELEKLR